MDDGCQCMLGYGGDACETQIAECPGNCTGHGECNFSIDNNELHGILATCGCQPGWGGADCALAACPQGCNEALGHGKCGSPGKCECGPRYYGDRCESTICPNDCSGNGTCNGLTCDCFAKYGGPACDILLGCPAGCETHGVCSGDTCVCDAGFFGVACEKVYCPSNCSEHGRCDNGKCLCAAGWSGDGCDNLENEGLCMAGCQTTCEPTRGRSTPSGGNMFKECLANCSASQCTVARKPSAKLEAVVQKVNRFVQQQAAAMEERERNYASELQAERGNAYPALSANDSPADSQDLDDQALDDSLTFLEENDALGEEEEDAEEDDEDDTEQRRATRVVF